MHVLEGLLAFLLEEGDGHVAVQRRLAVPFLDELLLQELRRDAGGEDLVFLRLQLRQLVPLLLFFELLIEHREVRVDLVAGVDLGLDLVAEVELAGERHEFESA